MNCLKSVHILRQHGAMRLSILSFLAMLFFFIVFYSIGKAFFSPTEWIPFRVHWGLAGLFLVYPVHKLLHGLPLWLAGRKAKMKIERVRRIPVISCVMEEAVSRNLAICSVLFPVLAISAGAFCWLAAAPGMLHYLALLAAANFGFSFVDLIYLAYFIRMPGDTFIEEFRDGFHVLTRTI